MKSTVKPVDSVSLSSIYSAGVVFVPCYEESNGSFEECGKVFARESDAKAFVKQNRKDFTGLRVLRFSLAQQ
jgi:hypothetical protein